MWVLTQGHSFGCALCVFGDDVPVDRLRVE
jgi:hypothetical protein